MTGTPRTNSMKPIANGLTTGRSERRPSANRMPNGSENTMPMVATTTVTRMPPHSAVGTTTSPISGAPCKQHDRTGSARRRKNRARRGRGAAPTATTANRCRTPKPQRKHRPASARRADRSHRRNRRTRRARRPSRRPGWDAPAKPDRPRRSAPDQTASMKKKRMSGGTPTRSSQTQRTSARYWPDWRRDWRAASRTRRPAPPAAAARSTGIRRRNDWSPMALIALSAPRSRWPARKDSSSRTWTG